MAALRQRLLQRVEDHLRNATTLLLCGLLTGETTWTHGAASQQGYISNAAEGRANHATVGVTPSGAVALSLDTIHTLRMVIHLAARGIVSAGRCAMGGCQAARY